jgi:hypothetical protein
MMNTSTEVKTPGLLDHMQRLLHHIRELAEETGKEEIINRTIQAPNEHISALTDVLHITPLQAVLFTLLFDRGLHKAVSMEDMAAYIECGNIELVKYLGEFEELQKKRLIRAEYDLDFFTSAEKGMPSYRVPLDVIKAVRSGTEYRFTGYNNLDPEDFFEIAARLLRAYTEGEIRSHIFISEIKDLMRANRKSAFVKKVGEYKLRTSSVTMLLKLCCALVNDDEEVVTTHKLLCGFDRGIRKRIERDMKTNELQIVECGLAEHDYNNGLADTAAYRLTTQAKEEFLAGVNLKEKAPASKRNLILASDIAEKRLYFPASAAQRVAELTSLLREENFRSVKERLTQNNMRTNFCCLFSGSPGTGKTETVYQIARETGRDIIFVDISDTKSKWFGESEKVIKQVFSRYKGVIKRSGVTPILMINEADAVLGKRQNLGEERQGPGQTENAIQNIILQEMETLEGGILIATTNMTGNLDKAFERRFLYKIEFEKPDAPAKTLIWQSHIHGLPEDDARTLAVKYDFSGGQIENVARKQVISGILSGDTPSLGNIMALCEEEALEKQTAKPIGFCA